MNRNIKSILWFFALVGGLVLAGMGGAFAQQQFGGATNSMHAALSCTTGGIAISDTDLAGSRELICQVDKGAAAGVFIYGNDPDNTTASEGQYLPVSTSSYVAAVLPGGNGVFRCAGDGSTVALNCLGVK